MAEFIEITESMTHIETKLAQFQNCWTELRRLMTQQVLPAIAAGRLPAVEDIKQVRELQGAMLRHSSRLFPAEPASSQAFTPMADMLQEKVNAWLTEKVEEYNLNPELLNPEGQAELRFNYKRYEARREWLEGFSDFKIPALLLQALENIGVDLDNLKEYLSEYDPDDLGMELQVDDGETVDSHEEVERA